MCLSELQVIRTRAGNCFRDKRRYVRFINRRVIHHGSIRRGALKITLMFVLCLTTHQPASISGFAPIFPDTCYHLTHYWLAAVDIPVASDNPVHYADAIRYNARTPLQGSLLPLTRLVWA